MICIVVNVAQRHHQSGEEDRLVPKRKSFIVVRDAQGQSQNVFHAKLITIYGYRLCNACGLAFSKKRKLAMQIEQDAFDKLDAESARTAQSHAAEEAPGPTLYHAPTTARPLSVSVDALVGPNVDDTRMRTVAMDKTFTSQPINNAFYTQIPTVASPLQESEDAMMDSKVMGTPVTSPSLLSTLKTGTTSSGVGIVSATGVLQSYERPLLSVSPAALSAPLTSQTSSMQNHAPSLLGYNSRLPDVSHKTSAVLPSIHEPIATIGLPVAPGTIPTNTLRPSMITTSTNFIPANFNYLGQAPVNPFNQNGEMSAMMGSNSFNAIPSGPSLLANMPPRVAEAPGNHSAVGESHSALTLRNNRRIEDSYLLPAFNMMEPSSAGGQYNFPSPTGMLQLQHSMNARAPIQQALPSSRSTPSTLVSMLASSNPNMLDVNSFAGVMRGLTGQSGAPVVVGRPPQPRLLPGQQPVKPTHYDNQQQPTSPPLFISEHTRLYGYSPYN